MGIGGTVPPLGCPVKFSAPFGSTDSVSGIGGDMTGTRLDCEHRPRRQKSGIRLNLEGRRRVEDAVSGLYVTGSVQ